MKKILCVLIALLFVLAGCQSDRLRDGTYTAQFASPDSHGWRAFIEITVIDGEYQGVVFDYKDESGNLKSLDQNYKNAYIAAGFGTYPELYTEELVLDFLFKQNATDVDIVAGATYASNDFIRLAEALKENIRKGNTNLLEVYN